MKIIRVNQLKQGYKVTTEDNKEYSIPYIKGTFLYKETKAYIDGGGVIKPEFTQDDLDRQAQSEAKLQKQKELNELVIDHNTVLYDAHGEALGNMATVIAIANATYNKAISVGINGTIMTNEDAYNYVYKNQTVTWKGADNKPHTVQLESLVEASQKAMTAKAEILFKY